MLSIVGGIPGIEAGTQRVFRPGDRAFQGICVAGPEIAPLMDLGLSESRIEMEPDLPVEHSLLDIVRPDRKLDDGLVDRMSFAAIATFPTICPVLLNCKA